MLTRLQVSGFKNLVDVDVRFGPFTCVIGPNGVGKSNLFDAIRFLNALAGHALMEAAALVRDQDSRNADVRNLFHRVGDRYAERMSFTVEMIVPRKAVDDLGQEAEASITFLRYSLAAESPTVVAARREMEAWRMLQLEPSALRRPDEFASPSRLGTDGSHLAATLYRLARNSGREGNGPLMEENTARTYTRLLQKPKDPLLPRSSREQAPRKSVIPAKAGIQRLS